MNFYKVYARPIQNNPGRETVYVQSIYAKNKKHACFTVANMVDNRGIYIPETFFAVREEVKR